VKTKTIEACVEKTPHYERNLNVPNILNLKRANSSFANKRYFIYVKKTCPRRSLDALKLQKHLIQNECDPVSSPDKADFIFVYTCGCFDRYEKLSISTVEKALENKSTNVIVTGCLPKINPDSLKKYETACIISTEDLMEICCFHDNYIYSELDNFCGAQGIHDLYKGKFLNRITLRKIIDFTRHFIGKLSHWPKNQTYAQDIFFSRNTYRIEIGQGCLGDCSYCAIKIGNPIYKSRSEEDIIEDFKAGLKENYKTFALMSGDIGCYGFDINTNLSSLLNKLFSIDGDFKILLWDLNVRWFVKQNLEMLSVLKNNPKKVERIILPIQSGSDRILKLMNRHYEIDDVKTCILNLKKNIPNIPLETHILVGFPGETDEDFFRTLELIREVEFNDIAIFAYEDRPGTKASDMPDKVPKDVIEQRKKFLRKEFEHKRKRE
jgi:threonylcarbamoyladenosine tRNA methylthiotransferase CDKAL1